MPLAALTLTACSLLTAAGPASASARPVLARPVLAHTVLAHTVPGQPSQVSSDLAGYVATGASGAFSDVSSHWTEPKGKCTAGDQYAAFFAGLDGWTSATIEQIGTGLDCVGGTPAYYAWYQMYPAAPVTFSSKVAAGDKIAASVTYKGSSEFTLKISDTTRAWSHTVTKVLAGAARSSAEVMAEAQEGSAGTLPLADFGSVRFTAAKVNKAGLCDSDPVEVTMPGVTVSPITDCTNFTVTVTQA